jgi:transposase-like protein
VVNDQEAWLEANTFYCERLKARITRKQCEHNRSLPGLNEAGARVNFEHHSIKRRPPACDKCKGYEEGKKTMGMSPNVKAETLKALQESGSQSEAARKLGVSQPSVYWRIKHDKDLMELAVRKGFIKGKKPKASNEGVKQEEATKRKPATINQDFEKHFPASSGSETTKSEPQNELKITDDPQKQTPPPIEHDMKFEPHAPIFAFKGLVVFLGETFWADIKLERRG